MPFAIIKSAKSPLRGTLLLPGDKSISHRRALFSLFSKAPCTLDNYGSGEDCATTLNCLRALGKMVKQDGNSVEISGDFSASTALLDCGNSGTTTRLLMGILAARRGTWTLHGDESLSNRPMERVAVPLRQMGADIQLTDGHLPAIIHGNELTGITYDSPVISAQVKSAVLLAGLRARGETMYREKTATRDHTERLLNLTSNEDGWLSVKGANDFQLPFVPSGRIPADPSSAAFWIAAALSIHGSEITFDSILLNEHRIAFLKLLQHIGLSLSISNMAEENGELRGELSIQFASLKPLRVTSEVAPSAIDEIPALAVLATRCNGRSEFYGVGELRIKESDRLESITTNLSAMGADVEVWKDGFAVTGPAALHGAEIDPRGDHRIAMALAIAALHAVGETRILNAECAAVSYPEFWNDLARIASGTVTLVT